MLQCSPGCNIVTLGGKSNNIAHTPRGAARMCQWSKAIEKLAHSPRLANTPNVISSERDPTNKRTNSANCQNVLIMRGASTPSHLVPLSSLCQAKRHGKLRPGTTRTTRLVTTLGTGCGCHLFCCLAGSVLIKNPCDLFILLICLCTSSSR